MHRFLIFAFFLSICEFDFQCLPPSNKSNIAGIGNQKTQLENHASDVCKAKYNVLCVKKLHFVGQNWCKKNSSVACEFAIEIFY